MAKKYSYFEFLFDQSGAALKAYLNDPNKGKYLFIHIYK